MTIYELVDMLETDKGCEAAWDGWDEVPGELLDKAFRENVEDFLLDAASVKAIMLEAMGVIPHDVIG